MGREEHWKAGPLSFETYSFSFMLMPCMGMPDIESHDEAGEAEKCMMMRRSSESQARLGQAFYGHLMSPRATKVPKMAITESDVRSAH
jgi:hypothetical protein